MHNIYTVLTNMAFAVMCYLWNAKWWHRHADHESKFYRFVKGQMTVFHAIKEKGMSLKNVYWFHVASLGEYAVARPVIRALRASSPDVTIVLTVFSPSGYDVLVREEGMDGCPHYVFYLPFDTASNVRSFLDAIRPKKAIFIISEYWMNYLRELGRREIPTYFISMLVHEKSYLHRWYARPIRRALGAVTTFMVQDEMSRASLHRMGFHNVHVTGDPLFDNALSVAQIPYHNDTIARFCQTAPRGVFIAGSISDERDLRLVAALSNRHPELKCIFAPHEVSEEILNRIKYELRGYTLAHSECDEQTDFEKVNVLVIDFIGALAKIYRYGRWAYVGGGFSPYLHSVVEPLAYGIPVSFGPCIHRKSAPVEMIRLGIGTIVRRPRDFVAWYEEISRDEEQLRPIRRQSENYMKANTNVTKRIVSLLHETK